MTYTEVDPVRTDILADKYFFACVDIIAETLLKPHNPQDQVRTDIVADKYFFVCVNFVFLISQFKVSDIIVEITQPKLQDLIGFLGFLWVCRIIFGFCFLAT